MLTVKEVASSLGVSIGIIYKLIADRKIPCVRIGRAIRISSEDLRKYVEKNTVDAIEQ